MQSRYATPDNKHTTPKQLSKQAMHSRKKSPYISPILYIAQYAKIFQNNAIIGKVLLDYLIHINILLEKVVVAYDLTP